MTEITDSQDEPGRWVFYDDDCRLCVVLARAAGPVLARMGFRLAALREPWVVRLLGGVAADEMKVIAHDGRVIGGADGLVYLAGRNWWSRPVWWAARVPAVRGLMRRGYRWIAARRTCAGGACRV